MEKEHFEVIFEYIIGKFDLMLEGHEGLQHEISDSLSSKHTIES